MQADAPTRLWFWFKIKHFLVGEIYPERCGFALEFIKITVKHVCGENIFILFTNLLHHSNTSFNPNWIFELNDDPRNDSEELEIRDDLIIMLVAVSSSFDVIEKVL